MEVWQDIKRAAASRLEQASVVILCINKGYVKTFEVE